LSGSVSKGEQDKWRKQSVAPETGRQKKQHNVAGLCAPGEFIQQHIWIFKSWAKVMHYIWVHRRVVVIVGGVLCSSGRDNVRRRHIVFPKRRRRAVSGPTRIIGKQREVAHLRFLVEEGRSVRIVGEALIRGGDCLGAQVFVPLVQAAGRVLGDATDSV